MPLGAHRAWTKCASKHVLNKVMFFCCSLTKTYLFLNFFISRFTSLLSFLETIDCCWIWWHATSALRLFVQDLGTATVQPLLVEQPSVLAVFVACSFNSACDATFATRKLFAMLLWDFRQYVGSFIFNDMEWNCLNCIQVRSLERFLGAATQRVIKDLFRNTNAVCIILQQIDWITLMPMLQEHLQLASPGSTGFLIFLLFGLMCHLYILC